MSSDGVAIRASALNKRYEIYAAPRDRLKQFLLPRIARTFGRVPPGYFREFWALKDVSFEIRRGETVGVIGRNGAGKSTLLQILCGTLSPTSGTVEVTGRVAALLELGSGFNPEFSGRENVYLNAALHGLSHAEIDQRFDSIAAFADIGEFIDEPVKTYSSGMIVRLAFAVIAHVDADILVVDEALAVGDAAFVRKCMRFLRQFMEQGTVLFVSHDTASVRSLCSRAIWLERGQVNEIGEPKAISEHYLKAIYEAQQGASEKVTLESPRDLPSTEIARDMRLDFINQTQFRNDIRMSQFNPHAPSFGRGGVELASVRLVDSAGRSLAWVLGGEKVDLVVEALARQEIENLIVGFSVKDRLGQDLFGDNTYLSHCENPVSAVSGQSVTARFSFTMPILKVGDYSIDIAIADGSQMEHVQLLWIHDAITLRSETSSVCNGLIGIPMQRVELAAR